MRMRWFLLRTVVALGAITGVLSPPAGAQVRLKDIAHVDDGGDLPLVGYGLVVGLDGTGDSRSSVFTMQSIGNMLTRLGVVVPEGQVRAKNTAAVMVVARLARHHRKGSRIDVSVSSLGDARSLQGGVLLHTPLATSDGWVYASAQGPVSVGGFSVQSWGSRHAQNHVLVGRVPNGGIVETEWAPEDGGDAIEILLDEPDYTNAQRVANAIDTSLPAVDARAVDAGTIRVEWRVPADSAAAPLNRVDLLATIESLTIEPDAVARVVLNERTGTIVAGERVTLASVAIAHANLSVWIGERPAVSQPAPYSRGETVVTNEPAVEGATDPGAFVPVPEAASVGDLARALNVLGVGPRDLIAIFQALKEAGALRAELRIL